MTAADDAPAAAKRALCASGQCPAASAYGDFLRRKGVLGAVPVVTPAEDVADGEREVRRAVVNRFRL